MANLKSVSFLELPPNAQMRVQWTTDGGDTVPLYIGKANKGVGSDADLWTIQKFTYDGSGNVTLIQTAYGDWDSRASLSYE